MSGSAGSRDTPTERMAAEVVELGDALFGAAIEGASARAIGEQGALPIDSWQGEFSSSHSAAKNCAAAARISSAGNVSASAPSILTYEVVEP